MAEEMSFAKKLLETNVLWNHSNGRLIKCSIFGERKFLLSFSDSIKVHMLSCFHFLLNYRTYYDNESNIVLKQNIVIIEQIDAYFLNNFLNI